MHGERRQLQRRALHREKCDLQIDFALAEADRLKVDGHDDGAVATHGAVRAVHRERPGLDGATRVGRQRAHLVVQGHSVRRGHVEGEVSSQRRRALWQADRRDCKLDL